jgi:hypothetical protein
VIDFEVYDRRPSDSDLLVPAIDAHQAAVGRVPYLLAADAAFYSRKNEAAARSKGVKRICVPNRSSKSPERRREQKKRWFRNGQKWRTGCEGRITVTKRRHGLMLPLQGRKWNEAIIEAMTGVPQGELTVARLCAISHLGRADYYRHFRASAPRQEETSVRDAIQRIALKNRFYGYRRIRAELRREGFLVNHKRIQRLM